jgi:HTH-type transcriptional regulator/antitoxin HigA
MEGLLYKVIKKENQYNQYCKELEELILLKKKNKARNEIVDLLTLLIEKWDEEHNTFSDADPIEVLRYLMDENKLKSVDLARLLGTSPGLVSDILNYRRGLSKQIIRKLSHRFKITQELLNRPYKLKSPVKANLKNARVRKISKRLAIGT